MKVCCISDLHGNLPNVPACDVLVIAGDVCPHAPTGTVGSYNDLAVQAGWLAGPFARWLDAVPATHVVACWGNHDFVGQLVSPLNLPRLRWTMLSDSGATIGGVMFWGTPWSPWFYNWAFNAPQGQAQGERFLMEKFSRISPDTDVLIAHGPPLGFGDRTDDGLEVGSAALLDAIERVSPSLAVVGHIHEGYGQYQHGSTTIVNASVLDQRYRLVNPPHMVEVTRREWPVPADAEWTAEASLK